MNRTADLRRVVLAVAAVGALAAAVVASSIAAPAKKSTTTLTVWTWDDAQLKSQAAGFEKAYPDVDVKYVHIAAPDLYQKVQLAAASGSGMPDVLLVEDSHIAQLVKLKALADITSWAKPYKTRIVAYKWNEVTQNGHIYGFPWDAGPVALYYRRDVFQSAGVNPTKLKTWSDWIAAGVKIKKKTGVPLWIQSKAANDARFFETLLWQQGSGYVDATGNVTIDKDPRALAALNLLGTGWKAGLFGDATEWTDPWYKAISGGQSATLPMAAWMGGFLKSWLAPNSKGQWGVVPLPAFQAGGSTSANDGGSGLAIAATSPNKDVARDYIRFYLGRADISSRLWQASDFFPALLSAWRTPYTNAADAYYGGAKVQRVFTQAAKTIPVAHVYSSDYQQMDGIMSTEIQKFALGKQTAAQALKNAAKEIRARTGRK